MKDLGFHVLEIKITGTVGLNGVCCFSFHTLYNLIKSAKIRESSRVKPKRKKLHGYVINNFRNYSGLRYSLFQLLILYY